MDVWSQYFREIPCAVTLVPAKDYASSEGMLEINLIALKGGSTRRKQVVEVDIPGVATTDRASAPATLSSRPG